MNTEYKWLLGAAVAGFMVLEANRRLKYRFELKEGGEVWLVLGLPDRFARHGQDEQMISVVKSRVRRLIDEDCFYDERDGIFLVGKNAFELEADAVERALSYESLRVERMVEKLKKHRLNYIRLSGRLEE